MSRSKITIPARRVPQIQRPSVGPRDLVMMVPELAQPQAGAARQWPLIASTACSCCLRCMGSVAGTLLGWLSRPLIGGSPLHEPDGASGCISALFSKRRSHLPLPNGPRTKPSPEATWCFAPTSMSMPPLISPRLSPHSVPFSHPLSPRPMSRTCSWHPRRRRELPHQPEPS